MDLRLSTAALLLMAAPLLAACGEDPVHDYSDPGTVVGTPGGPESEKSSPVAAPDGIDLEKGTIQKSSLSTEQAQLYDEMVAFEPVARAKAAETDPASGGGSIGTFNDDPENDFSMRRPAGVQAATGFEIAWANGKVQSYALTTESGERMAFEDGAFHVDVSMPAVSDPDLTAAVDALLEAMHAWKAEHGAFPAVSDDFDGVVLNEGLFSEADTEVEVELPEDIDYGGYGSTGDDDYSVVLESDETMEKVTITQDGQSVVRTLRVV